MKLKLRILLCAAAALFAFGCSHNTDEKYGKKLSTPKTASAGSKEHSGSIPAESGGASETVMFTLEDLMTAFSLSKGEITASDAAKKVKDGAPAASGVTFSERKIISYDDKAGTFAVGVKGTKDGKSFSNTVSADGFTHPYASAPSSKSADATVKLGAALEENLKLSAFVDMLNSASNLTDYLNLKFTLTNGKEIGFGTETQYKLSASFSVDGGKIKLAPKYEVVYRSLSEGAAAETVNTEEWTTATSVFQNLKYDYFTEANVFTYVAERIRDEIINVNDKTFASSLYAPAKYLGTTPQELFKTGDGSKFKKYQETYKKNDGQLKIVNGSSESDLQIALYNPKNGGISADDYTGTLKAQYFVQRAAFIGTYASDSHTGSTAIVPSEAEQSGFMKVNEDFLKNFLFSIVKNGSDKTTAKKSWLQKSLSSVSLLREKSTSSKPFCYELENQNQVGYKNSTDSYYYLTVNGDTSFSNWLAKESNWYLSTAKALGTEYKLLVTSIRMTKQANDKHLTLLFGFEGNGEPINLTLEPTVWD
ncbi:MAG: hypothetical protein ACTTKL_11110 [Treponema sp.]